MADRSLADRLAAMQSSADTEEEFDEILISRHSPPVQNHIVKLPLDRLVDYADEHFEEITGRPQPFRLYDEDSLRSLADSIRENGVMQPIIVRPLPDGSYQVIAGRNRRRASALCGLTMIPAIVKKDLDDVGAAMFMLDTNLEQRKGLCYSEKAYAYKMRLELQGRRGQRTDITGADKIDTLQEVGKQNGDSRRTVAYLIRLTYLIPSLLRIREIAADAHYIVSDAQYPVEFTYAGQDTALVEIHANGGEQVENRLKRGKVTGSKTDEDGQIVSGAVFGLFAENETVFSADTALLTAASDADGRFVFSDVPYGKWQVRELSVPKPYALSDRVYPVVVGEDGAAVAIEAVNRYITGSIRIVKRDADTGETLAGTEFALYDRNGTEVARKTTGQDGTAVFDGLRCGSYTVKETKAADGYVLSDTVTSVEIADDGQTLTVERTNRRIPREPESPQTGDSSPALWLALPAGLGSLLTVFGVRRRRRN